MTRILLAGTGRAIGTLVAVPTGRDDTATETFCSTLALAQPRLTQETAQRQPPTVHASSSTHRLLARTRAHAQ